MKYLKYTSLLLLLSVLLTGCIQISLPPNDPAGGTGSGDREEVTSGPAEEDTARPKLVLDTRGSVSSAESDSVVLRSDWHAISEDGRIAEVTVQIYLSYRSLSKGKSTGTVTVNGQTQSFAVKAIEKQTDSKVTIPLGSFVFFVPLSDRGVDLDLETVWELNKNMDGIYVESLNASAVFPLWSGVGTTENTKTATITSQPSPKSQQEE